MTPVLRRRLLVVAVGLGCVVLLGRLVSESGTTTQGYQVSDDVPVSIGSATGRLWTELGSLGGAPREGFPDPLISTTDGWCFGFERVDFTGPARPSVARCIAADDVPDLAPDEVAAPIQVVAGSDVWHIVAFGRPVDEVDVDVRGGGPIDPSRVHLFDRFAALRLPIDAELSSVEWVDGRVRVRCEDPPAWAVTTGQFCPERPSG